MRSWDLNEIEVQPRQPEVLVSEQEGRAIVLELPAGEALEEHQVHERGWLLVASGRIEIHDSDGERFEGGPGLLAEFDPNERREIRASESSRILLILSPWPGEGHPRRRD